MTTKHSPLSRLKRQAEQIAMILKKAERGEPVPGQFAEKVAAARNQSTFKTAIIMDDKIITLEIAWETIRETDEVALVEYIVRQMREVRDAVH